MSQDIYRSQGETITARSATALSPLESVTVRWIIQAPCCSNRTVTLCPEAVTI